MTQFQRIIKVYEKTEEFFSCGVTLIVGKADEDNYSVTLKDKNGSACFGVFDGHGGTLASSLCSGKFSEKIFEHLEALLADLKKHDTKSQGDHIFDGLLCEAVKRATKDISEYVKANGGDSGTTATLLVMHRNPGGGNTKLFCVNIGDSRCVLGKVVKRGMWSPAVDLSTDHNLQNESEVRRITEKIPVVWPMLPENAYCLHPNKNIHLASSKPQMYTEAQCEEIAAMLKLFTSEDSSSNSSINNNDEPFLNNSDNNDDGNDQQHAVMYTHTSREATPSLDQDAVDMELSESSIADTRVLSKPTLKHCRSIDALDRTVHGPSHAPVDLDDRRTFTLDSLGIDSVTQGGVPWSVLEDNQINSRARSILEDEEEDDSLLRKLPDASVQKCIGAINSLLDNCTSSLKMTAATCFLSPSMIEAMEGRSVPSLVLFSVNCIDPLSDAQDNYDFSQAKECFEMQSLLETPLSTGDLLISLPLLHDETQHTLGVVQVMCKEKGSPDTVDGAGSIKNLCRDTASIISTALQTLPPPIDGIVFAGASSSKSSSPLGPHSSQISASSSAATLDGKKPQRKSSFIAHRFVGEDGRHVGPLALFGRFEVSTLMTRSIGGKYTARSCVCVPEISVCEVLKNEFARVILATDGVWDVISSKEALDFVRGFSDPVQAARQLAMKARLLREQMRIKIDDVTVIIVDINPQLQPKGFFSSLFSICGTKN